jgi:hypothetical protein
LKINHSCYGHFKSTKSSERYREGLVGNGSHTFFIISTGKQRCHLHLQYEPPKPSPLVTSQNKVNRQRINGQGLLIERPEWRTYWSLARQHWNTCDSLEIKIWWRNSVLPSLKQNARQSNRCLALYKPGSFLPADLLRLANPIGNGALARYK